MEANVAFIMYIWCKEYQIDHHGQRQLAAVENGPAMGPLQS